MNIDSAYRDGFVAECFRAGVAPDELIKRADFSGDWGDKLKYIVWPDKIEQPEVYDMKPDMAKNLEEWEKLRREAARVVEKARKAQENNSSGFIENAFGEGSIARKAFPYAMGGLGVYGLYNLIKPRDDETAEERT